MPATDHSSRSRAASQVARRRRIHPVTPRLTARRIGSGEARCSLLSHENSSIRRNTIRCLEIVDNRGRAADPVTAGQCGWRTIRSRPVLPTDTGKENTSRRAIRSLAAWPVQSRERDDRRADDRTDRRSEACRAAAVESVRLCRATDPAVRDVVNDCEWQPHREAAGIAASDGKGIAMMAPRLRRLAQDGSFGHAADVPHARHGMRCDHAPRCWRRASSVMTPRSAGGNVRCRPRSCRVPRRAPRSVRARRSRSHGI